MAINIQEILHPSDSDSIKFEKINYNFDQILANGGGPVGPKGQKGIQGVLGQTGEKGEKGDLGPVGPSGETTSPWKSIAIDLNAQDGVNDVTILKPKPQTDKETPVIWLGDSAFINDGNSAGDGDVTLRSTLNVSRHSNFGPPSSIEAGYVTLWHDANNKIRIDSEDVSTGSGFVRYNITPVQPITGSQDIRLQIKAPTIHTETFQLDNQAASGALSSGMIRYNSGGNKFEGYINNAWVEFCMDPCGQGGQPVQPSISISVGDLNLNADGTLVGSGSSSPTPAPPAFVFGDWTGSVSVDALGTINITNGNVTTITTDPTSFAENSTVGDNQVDITVTLTAPAGYSNAGSPIISVETVTQPTNYSAPSSQTGTYSVNYGGYTSADTCAGTGATSTATGLSVTVNNTSPTAQQWRDAAELAAASYLSSNYPNQLLAQGGYFKVISITNHQGTTVLAPTNWCELDAGAIGDSGECGTGTASYFYATSSANACDLNNVTGSRSNVDVPLPADPTSHTQWLDQAQAACGIHHANADLTIANVNPWIAVYEIFDHNGAAIQPIGDETVLIQPTNGNISQLVACSTTAPGGPPPSG